MQPRPLAAKRATLLALLLGVSLLMAMAACVPKKPALQEQEPSPLAMINPDVMDDDTVYSKGLQAFWLGDYKTAATLFERLARRLDDQAFRSKALFALACAKLAGAESQEDFKAAREVWHEWEQASSDSLNQADPKMLTPFIQNFKQFVPAKDSHETKLQPSKLSPGEQDLAKRLQEKEKEVLLLQKQIKALEAIHREIQEKKKMSGQ